MMMEFDCQCNTPAGLKLGGDALGLCHHSPVYDMAELEKKLQAVLSEFDRNIDPVKVFEMAPKEAIEYYITEIIQQDPEVASPLERAIYTTIYVKHYVILLQLLMLRTLTGIRKGEFAPV